MALNLKPLDRIRDTTRPEIGEVVFSFWGTAWMNGVRGSRGTVVRAAVCYIPGRRGQVRIVEKNIVTASEFKSQETMKQNGTKRGPAPRCCPATPLTPLQRALMKERLQLTDAELDEAFAD